MAPLATVVNTVGEATLKAIEEADPVNPGVQRRPTIGITFVDIPELPDLGTKVSQDISAVIAGKTSVDDALNNGQKLAEAVGEKYKGQ
jgi:sorbitol/mannitol transport system substrate-binding protein